MKLYDDSVDFGKYDLETAKEARNNRKKRKIKTTYTTGNPYYNIKMFNKRMGTDFNNPSTAEAQKAAIEAAEDVGTIAAPSPDGASFSLSKLTTISGW